MAAGGVLVFVKRVPVPPLAVFALAAVAAEPEGGGVVGRFSRGWVGRV